MALRSRTRSTRLLVVALVSVSLMTITVDYRQGSSGPLAGIGRVALTVISPMQEAVSKVTRPIGNFLSTLVHLPSIREANQRLTEENKSLRVQIATAVSNEQRVKELEGLLAIQATIDLPTTGARVIASGVSNFEWMITIDKGSSDGVKADMPIIAAPGLVGHVVRVAPNASDVQLIIDPDSRVVGRLVDSRKTGLLEGRGENDLQMGLVDPSTEVGADEQVETAGYQTPTGATGLYPPGILIGTVSRVLEEPGALEKFVTVRPAVDFSSLEYVLVVLSDGSG